MPWFIDLYMPRISNWLVLLLTMAFLAEGLRVGHHAIGTQTLVGEHLEDTSRLTKMHHFLSSEQHSELNNSANYVGGIRVAASVTKVKSDQLTLNLTGRRKNVTHPYQQLNWTDLIVAKLL